VTGTVGTALKLTSPLTAHPLLKSIVADCAADLAPSASPAITSAMQTRFVTLYDANTAAMPDFWTSLASDPQLGAVVPQLQLTLQLGTLTQKQPGPRRHAAGAVSSGQGARSDQSSAPTSWSSLMTTENIQVPAAIAATTTPATIAQYANSIVSSLKEAFPTDYVAKLFGVSTDATNQAVAAFLGASTDFDFAAANVDGYWRPTPPPSRGSRRIKSRR